MKPKLTILDGFAATQTDITWQGLEAIADITVYDRTAPEDVVRRCEDSEMILTNKVVIGKDIIDSLTRLRYIGVLATGYNIIDTGYAASKGIVVTNVPAYSTASVAQMVFAHLLNVTNSISHYADACRNGRWASAPDFCFVDTPLHELAGMTMGIVGFGNIGRKVAGIALALGMKVVAVTSKRQDELPEGVTSVPLERMLRSADVVSLHCPLTPETSGMIRRETIRMMKRGAIVINTGRGPLVNDADVADALASGHLAAYCADVLSTEPPLPSNPLLSQPHAYFTPHIAWATSEARQRLVTVATENVRAFIEGDPQNNVAK